MTPWPHQIRALANTTTALATGSRRVCVTAATGMGKTRMMLDLISWAQEQSWRIALYTNRRMLLSQTERVFEKNGFDVGIRAAGYDPALLRDIQICSTQTEISKVLKRGKRDIHPANLVIIDELHNQKGSKLEELLAMHYEQEAVMVGYTATPIDLGDMVDELLLCGTVSEGRACGALVAANTFAPDQPDLRQIKNYQVGVDLSEKDNAKAIMRPGIFGRVCESWKAHNPEQKATILFAPDVAGSIYFAEEFTKAGIRAAHIDGSDVWIDGEMHPNSQELRDYVSEQSKMGEIKVVCNRFVLREGIDWPWIECGILATVFGSLSSYIQSGGRLLRACPSTGKQSALVLDHGGNWHRHGSLNEDRHWELGCTNTRLVGERMEKLREHKIQNQSYARNAIKYEPAGGYAHIAATKPIVNREWWSRLTEPCVKSMGIFTSRGGFDT